MVRKYYYSDIITIKISKVDTYLKTVKQLKLYVSRLDNIKVKDKSFLE